MLCVLQKALIVLLGKVGRKLRNARLRVGRIRIQVARLFDPLVLADRSAQWKRRGRTSIADIERKSSERPLSFEISDIKT